MGAFQFSQPTWNEATQLAGLPQLIGVPPNQASKADQDTPGDRVDNAEASNHGSTGVTGGSTEDFSDFQEGNSNVVFRTQRLVDNIEGPRIHARGIPQLRLAVGATPLAMRQMAPPTLGLEARSSPKPAGDGGDG